MRFVLAFLALLLGIDTAAAISDAQIPTKVPVTWGSSAPGPNITCPMPIPSQIGITPGRGSWTDGFPPLTFTSPGAGGVPPFGADFNGVLCQISQWTQWQNAGGPLRYDSAFSSSVNGYPKGAVLESTANPNCFWASSADNNTSNPDASGANWIGFCLGAGIGGTSTGTANAQAVSGTPLTIQNGVLISFTVGSGLTNTASATIAYNGGTAYQVYRQGGLVQATGQEMQAGQTIFAYFSSALNGASGGWVLLSGSFGYLDVQDQTLAGGANVTSLNLGTISTGTVTIDCGARPLQYLTDTGTFTIAAPANDGSCTILMTNGAGAQVPTFSGFTVNSNTGEAITTTNGNKFLLSIVRINATSTYLVKSLQ